MVNFSVMLRSLGSSCLTVVSHRWPEEARDRVRKRLLKDFTSGSDGKEPACNVGDPGLIPGSEDRCPGEGMAIHSIHIHLENSTVRGAWQATVHGVVKSRTRLSHSHVHFSLKD